MKLAILTFFFFLQENVLNRATADLIIFLKKSFQTRKNQEYGN